VAHVCASSVTRTERSFFLFDDFPGWLVDLATKDCNLAVN
jgi:hypothetical protein